MNDDLSPRKGEPRQITVQTVQCYPTQAKVITLNQKSKQGEDL